MIRQRDSRQAPLFDPWGHLGPKRRRLLEDSWAGLFRREILPLLPVQRLALHFRADFGRPAKELRTVLGVLALQQMHDLTDVAQEAYGLLQGWADHPQVRAMLSYRLLQRAFND